MTEFSIPNIFTAGTKAKAYEVNENFAAVKDAINDNADSIAANAQNLTSLEDYVDGDFKDELENLIESVSKINFCVNSAQNPLLAINSTNSSILDFNVNDGTTYKPLIATPAPGAAFELTSIPSLNMSTYASGTYNIFVDETGNTEAYKNTIYAQATEPVPDTTFAQPTLSSNGTLGGSAFAVSATNTTANAWKPFASQLYQSTANPGTVDFTAYNPTALHVNSITVKGGAEAPYYPSAFTLYASNDNSTWTNLGNYTNSDYSERTITINSYTGFYKYYKISITSFAYYSGYPYLFISKLVLNGTILAPNDNNVWLDTSIEPLRAFKHNGTNWEAFNLVPVGSATVSSSAIASVATFDFNQNGYNFNVRTFKKSMPLIREYFRYDFKAGVSKSTSGFTADTQGLCIFKSVNSVYGSCSIDGATIFSGGGYTDNSEFIFEVFSGNVIVANSQSLKFYPIKGGY